MKRELLENLIRICVRQVLENINEAADAYYTMFKPLHPDIIDILKSENPGVEFYFDPSKPLEFRMRSVYSKEFNDGRVNVEHTLRKYKYQYSIHTYLEENKKIMESDEEIKGASAPPADGQGTADQPSIPKDKSGENSPESFDDETPDIPTSSDLKGNILVNPRDKSKMITVNLDSTANDASLERNLYKEAAKVAGSKVKVALSTLRMVKDTVRNPNSTTYLYIGKYDPNSDEVFLMADKSLQVAKDASVTPADLTGTPVSQVAPSTFQPSTAPADDFVQHMAQGNKTPVRGIDERLKKVIKKMVNEIIGKYNNEKTTT